jgi:hypothetical protein
MRITAQNSSYGYQSRRRVLFAMSRHTSNLPNQSLFFPSRRLVPPPALIAVNQAISSADCLARVVTAALVGNMDNEWTMQCSGL